MGVSVCVQVHAYILFIINLHFVIFIYERMFDLTLAVIAK